MNKKNCEKKSFLNSNNTQHTHPQRKYTNKTIKMKYEFLASFL